jgi:hypothetical protein
MGNLPEVLLWIGLAVCVCAFVIVLNSAGTFKKSDTGHIFLNDSSITKYYIL